MKKRTNSSASSPSSPSSSSSSSSSSSCVVDDDLNHDNQQINENEKPPKPPKRVRKTKPEKSLNTNTQTNRRSSIYRGVTRHRWTGRFEAHLWDKSCWNTIQNKKGRQVYLGAYDSEVDAARTYDLAALKYWGPETTLNFPIGNYTKDLEEMQNVSREEYLASLRRQSSGFSRGVSKYRGVARHHHNGRWEARIGRVLGNKYLYLGTFSSQEEAAAAYDLAAIEYRGANAVTNFDISNYIGRVKNLMPKGQSQQPKAIQQQRIKQHKEEDREDQTDVGQQVFQQVEQHEQIEIVPSKFEESELISTIDHSSMLIIGSDDDREDPWSFCLDTGDYNSLLVPNIPLEEDGRLLDLFDQTGFEDNIDLIFEGEGNFISIDKTYFDGMEDMECQTHIKVSEDLDNKNLPSIKNSLSFSSSSTPSSPSLTTSFVSC